MKKIVLLFIITFCGLIGYAQNWKIGVYYNALNQRVNFLEESSHIFQKNNDFNSFESGINKVWENNSILINEVGGGQNFYTISSNGSCINIGLGLGYCF